MAQPFASTVGLPCAETAPEAVGSSARMQSLEVWTATARANSLTGCLPKINEKRRACGWLTITSTSPLTPAWEPERGGLFAVTVAPATPLTKL